MDADPEAQPPQPRRLVHKLLHVVKRHTDDPSAPDPQGRRMDAPPTLPAVESPRVQGATTWSQVGGVRVPKSRSHPDPVQLPDSRAEPGGPPVYADPNMVTPAAAEKMRPLFRRQRPRA
jgi:hypothetical protein